MGRISEIVRDYGWRVLLALPCFGIAGYLIMTASRTDAGDVMVSLLGGAVFLLVGIVIVLPLVLEFLAEPLRSVFYPGGRASRPAPMYSVPQSKRAKGFYEEALTGFRKIALNYPGDIKPYLEMLDIAVHNLKDAERAKSILFEALAHPESEADRQTVQNCFDMQIEGLAPPPEWLKQLAEQRLTPPKIDPRQSVDEPDGRSARRFHPGGFNHYEGPDGDRFVDTRPKVHYPNKKKPPDGEAR
jgi:hypothetical protein